MRFLFIAGFYLFVSCFADTITWRESLPGLTKIVRNWSTWCQRIRSCGKTIFLIMCERIRMTMAGTESGKSWAELREMFRATFWSTRKSDLQRELVKRCYYLMRKAQQNNFCFCYFAERFMLKAKIRFGERLCMTWFSLAFITSAFSPRQSEKVNWSMKRPLEAKQMWGSWFD